MKTSLMLTYALILLNVARAAATHGKRYTKLKKRHIPDLIDDFVAISDVSRAAPDVDKQGKGKECPGSNGSAGGGGGDKSCGGVNIKSMFGKGNPKEKASNIAQQAAQTAKAASDAQATAGQAAAQQIKTELAERAMQSAKAAEAALAGKEQILQQLNEEVREAEAVVLEETNALQASEANMNAAVQASTNAQEQVQAITAIVQTAQENLVVSQAVASGSQQELAQKTQLLEAAKNRVDLLQKQLVSARQDFEKTKTAAYKAACSAVEAKQKVLQRGTRFV